MIIIDKKLQELEEKNRQIRVGMIGAGFMGQGIALQIEKYTPGMTLVAICNRNPNRAQKVLDLAGGAKIQFATNQREFEQAIRMGNKVVTDDPFLLTDSEQIDVLVEVTGAVEFSAQVVLRAIESQKHVVTMNAELDGTIGPILKVKADKKKVVFTNADGDQPGVILNLYRYVKGIGLKPVLCGNIKGLHDPYRNPTTQAGFAKKWGQNPMMVTSFADGTKISFEQTVVANATGMKVARRGMFGPEVPAGTAIEKAISVYPEDVILGGEGIVDYIVGAHPPGGVFVLGTIDHPLQKHYLNLYKVGEGPLYCFFTPYHLCHFEVPRSIARACLFADATISPQGAPTVEVVTAAKRNIKKGEVIDGLGGYMTYGLCENVSTARQENLLPIGLAEGAILNRDVPRDTCLTFADVFFPEKKVSRDLWLEQMELFYPQWSALVEERLSSSGES